MHWINSQNWSLNSHSYTLIILFIQFSLLLVAKSTKYANMAGSLFDEMQKNWGQLYDFFDKTLPAKTINLIYTPFN